MALKGSLRQKPVIYEIVPPRRDAARFNTEPVASDAVLDDARIDAINIPELMTRREENGRVVYSPGTIPPEEYALMVKDRKETIVNLIAPRLTRDEFLKRSRRILRDYGVRNLVLVGKERHGDALPGPGVVEGLKLLGEERARGAALGGICIFGRGKARGAGSESAESSRRETSKVLAKAGAGCDFVTSQIVFDDGPALRFLSSYNDACTEAGADPLTVFISLTSIPSANILSLVERLDVVIPPKTRARLTKSSRMGPESVAVAVEVLEKIVDGTRDLGIRVPLGLQIEQVGVNSGDISLGLLEKALPVFK